MTAGFGLLGTEGRTEGIDTAKRHCRSFHVQLSALRQIGIFFKILGVEQIGSTFCRGWRQDWRIHLCKSVLVEKLLNRADDFRTNHEHSPLLRGTKPEVTVIHQEIHAVLLRGDRIILCKMQYLYPRHSHFISGLTARLLADDSGHIQ
ncbi:hypothetical protein D3C87_1690790 [compost metagenome]